MSSSEATPAVGAGIYEVPEELGDFRDLVRRLAQDRIGPRAAEIDETGEYPWDVRELLASHDILGLPFDTEYGGTGTGTLMLQIAVEEIAKVCASSALILMVQELGTLPIQLFGSDELKQRLLPKCASGEWSPAFALSEPEAGSDPGVDADHRSPGRRRVGHQRIQELDHQRLDRRLLRRLRRDRPREPPDHRLRRREGSARASRSPTSSASSGSRARRPARPSSTTSGFPPPT